MIPYADFTYWGLLLYPTLPSFVLAWGRRIRQAWILLATCGMLAVQYSAEHVVGQQYPVREFWLIVGFAAFQFALARGFLQVRQRFNGQWMVWPFAAFALGPLVLGRVFAGQTGFVLLGMSYLTFRSLDVTISIQDRLIRELPLNTYLAYLLFFPSISAGPIDRYRRFLGDWARSRTRAEFLQDLDGAVHRIFTGFLYKFVLAELIRRYWMDPSASIPGPLGMLSYMYAYSLYLFFDFAGYTAFAIGVAYIFGVHVPENFNRPFLAGNIRDFWNRWHITLSWWLRDHVYMRFVVAATRRKWFRGRYVASYLGFGLSMGLMGAWHGFQLHFLAYGVYHAALLIGQDLFGRWNLRYRLWGTGMGWRIAGIVATQQFVCFGFLIFSGHLLSL